MKNKALIILILIMTVSFAQAQSVKDSLKAVISLKEMQRDSISKENRELKATIELMQKQIHADSVYLVNTVVYDIRKLNDDINYLSVPYSLMSLKHLYEMQADIHEFEDGVTERELANYRSRLAAAIETKRLFDRCERINREPFNYDSLYNNGNLLQDLYDIKADNPNKGKYKFSERQIPEVRAVLNSLWQAETGLWCLQEIIKNTRNAQRAKSKLEKALKYSTEDSYLKRIYGAYLQKKEANDPVINDIKQEILSFKVTE